MLVCVEVLTGFVHTTAPSAICLGLIHIKCLTIVFRLLASLSAAFDLTFANCFTCCSLSSDHLVGDAQWELPTPPKPLSSSPRPPVCRSAPPQLPLKTKTRTRRDPRYKTLCIQIIFCMSFVNVCTYIIIIVVVVDIISKDSFFFIFT